jgi:hypothetical protein
MCESNEQPPTSQNYASFNKIIAMISLLNFIIKFCPALFEHPRIRFKSSKTGMNPAEGSWILLESEDVQIFITNEHECITWEMKSFYDMKKIIGFPSILLPNY